MPPSMTFKYNRPGELQLVLCGGEMSAEDVVHVPDKETADKGNNGYYVPSISVVLIGNKRPGITYKPMPTSTSRA